MQHDIHTLRMGRFICLSENEFYNTARRKRFWNSVSHRESVAHFQGVTHEKSCSDGLFFNPHKGRCDDRQKIDLCTEPGKYPDVTLAAMFVFSIFPQNDIKCRCTSQFNGCYSYGCSSHYYCCSYGNPTEVGDTNDPPLPHP